MQSVGCRSTSNEPCTVRPSNAHKVFVAHLVEEPTHLDALHQCALAAHYMCTIHFPTTHVISFST